VSQVSAGDNIFEPMAGVCWHLSTNDASSACKVMSPSPAGSTTCPMDECILMPDEEGWIYESISPFVPMVVVVEPVSTIISS
jgi:hypothetical protein